MTGFVAPSEHLEERVEELETEVQQLKAELRKYEPSDSMMIVLLQRDDVIREAERLLRVAGTVTRDMPDFIDAVDAWLKHPTVVRAVTSPMAQAAVKP
jgi:archaellum component FlaC